MKSCIKNKRKKKTSNKAFMQKITKSHYDHQQESIENGGKHAAHKSNVPNCRKKRPGSRDEHRSGLDLTGSRLKPILAGSGLDRTATF